MIVIKRNGEKEQFNVEKIVTAVTKAFQSVNEEIPHAFTQTIRALFEINDTIEVEEIQDRVEQLLMHDGYYNVAKSYILYRARHKQIRDFADKKIKFINKYINSDNNANATIDDNSNVSNHNIATLNSEIHKEENYEVNLRILENKVKSLYPDFDYKQMVKDFNTICYLHDSNSQIGMPYCVAISMYPFLLEGIKGLGGLSASPKNIDSFCGMFINLVFAVASQFKGAVATPGVLLCMDYFCRKEWGDTYYLKPDAIITSDYCTRKKTIQDQIHQYFQQICYSLMQPSGSRGSQACFWNLSIFDKEFYNTMYGDFQFPDGSSPIWESLNWLQKDFVHWLNQERLKCVLTFPVVSAALIYKDGEFVDKELYDFVCQEYSEGNSFFTYISDSADSLSSCCRLSSKISKPQFNFTNGQLSEMTGSKNVITLNFNRIIQDFTHTIITNLGNHATRELLMGEWFKNDEIKQKFKTYLITILDRVYKYHIAYNECLKDLYKANMLSAYSSGFIDMNKQYLTIGINGLNQMAEFLGIECNNNKYYEELCNLVFTTIKEQNTSHKTAELMFNSEFTPCESASIKLYNRDKNDGYWVPSDTNLYASYIFKPNDTNISILDKINVHGNAFCGDNLDGGSSAHLNLEEHLTKEQYAKLVKHAAEVGCKYFTFNVVNSECDDCSFITKVPIKECPKCHSKNITHYDRVIGYLTAIKNWSEGRQIEQKTRVYHGSKN